MAECVWGYQVDILPANLGTKLDGIEILRMDHAFKRLWSAEYFGTRVPIPHEEDANAYLAKVYGDWQKETVPTEFDRTFDPKIVQRPPDWIAELMSGSGSA